MSRGDGDEQRMSCRSIAQQAASVVSNGLVILAAHELLSNFYAEPNSSLLAISDPRARRIAWYLSSSKELRNRAGRWGSHSSRQTER